MHDYKVEWDYEVDSTPGVIQHIAQKYQQNLDEIAALMQVENPTVAFVVDLEVLGKYIMGTYSQPVIVLDSQQIIMASQKYGVDIETTIYTTLLHEMGHAIVESLGSEIDSDINERICEEFAHSIWSGVSYKRAWEDLQNFVLDAHSKAL